MSSWVDIKRANKVVVKVGSSTLTYPNGRLNYQRLCKLAEYISAITKKGKKCILVSSGAVAVGSGRLGLGQKPDNLADKQAIAAVGQSELIRIYRKFFRTFNMQVAQVLLTKDIVSDPVKYENARNTINELLDMDIIPIINENDTVSTEGIEFGDNDTLSAYVAGVAKADLLILLSDIDGLFSEDPKNNPEASIISEVTEITEQLTALAKGSGSAFGTGGMATKIGAAKICYNEGIKMVISNGAYPEQLVEITEGRGKGTLFSWKTY